MQHNQDQGERLNDRALEVMANRFAHIQHAAEVMARGADAAKLAAQAASIGGNVVHYPEYLGPDMPLDDGGSQAPSAETYGETLQPPHTN